MRARRKKRINRKRKVDWEGAMIINSDFLAFGRKKYNKHFDIPSELEDYRKKKGLIPRPKRFQFD